MPFEMEDLQLAAQSLKHFRTYSVSPHHERYSFPLLRGTYFAYRKIDVLRVIAIAKAVSINPSYCEIGCGNGDFLSKIREFIPDAIGIENSASIFYVCNLPKPDYIKIADAHWGIDNIFDLVFLGWMEPGTDLRDAIAAKTDVIVTTLDQGISIATEFDAHGFEQIASWRTPSWEDVNTQIMNHYYTQMSKETYQTLYSLRGAHNLWYVYSNDRTNSAAIKAALQRCIEQESRTPTERYDFEDVLDECGFRYFEDLETSAGVKTRKERLWEIQIY
jgi:hypothetical protein